MSGSYAPALSGLSQIALEWMLCEAAPLGLLIDREKANEVLARVPPRAVRMEPPVRPNPAAPINNSLIRTWWILELLPHSYYDPVAKKKNMEDSAGGAAGDSGRIGTACDGD